MKKTITQHMKLTKAQRQAHTNPLSDCIPVVLGRDTSNGKAGSYANPEYARRVVKKILTQYHKLESFKGRAEKVHVHTCHLCKNDSVAPNGFVCKNPEHLYFGTASENTMDVPAEIRKKIASSGGKIGGKHRSPNGGRIAVKKAIANGNHFTQQKSACIHCGLVSNLGAIARWHNDRCKHKPMA